ncbi:MAG TPA: hypothetical protein VIZ30_06095 [Pseudomonadales bacterium]
MKVVGTAVIVLLLVVVGVFVYFARNTNAIVKDAIESVGSRYVGAPVRVGSVDISLADGRGTLKDLEIGNPPGYAGAYALRADLVSMTLDVAATTSALVVLNAVVVDGARVAAIAKSAQETNLGALARNVPASDSPAPKLIIDRLEMTNTQASVASPYVAQALDVDVPDVHLTQVGRSSGGADAGQVVRQILAPITRSITQSLSTTAMKRLGVDPKKATSEAQRAMQDKLRSLGHKD